MNIEQFADNWLLLILAIIFLSGLFIQLIFYLFIFAKIFVAKRSKVIHSSNEPVSVIICARNEAENLRANLPAILEQDYPDYEVIVVNDCSSDDTDNVLHECKTKYQHFRFTTIEKDRKFSHGKKLAVTVGVKAAKHEWLLFTDADCYPVSNQWIRKMQENFTPEASVVLGYGGYTKRKSLLNSMIRFDTMFIALQYITLAISGAPYMGVGRNLAYRKSLFFKNKGFANHYHIPSGDDDLFVNEVATRHNVRVEISPESITRSIAKKSITEWFIQKKRHVKTGTHYKMSSKIILGLESISRILYYMAFIFLLIFFSHLYLYIVPLFLFRTVIQSIIFKKTINMLSEKNILLASLFYDFILPLINLTFVMANVISTYKKTN